MGRPPAQVALAGLLAQPGVTAPILGASRTEQLRDNLAALELRLTEEHLRTLDEASVPGPNHDFAALLKRAVFAGLTVEGGH